ncbi:hypothetical protein JXA32_03165 [Candidatus Sumerlaeota bacterium]|nr:hypothetical protein [Candidatus Sumerlaeota bacterium]
MNELLSGIGAASGAIALWLVYVLRKSAQEYIDEKAKNLATREDIGRITAEVEAVKANYLRQTHAWKWIFEKEYEILRNVWDSTWELQATVRSLKPLWDHLPENKEEKMEEFRKRYNDYIKTVQKFQDMVMKNRPFIPPVIYETCLELSSIVGVLQNDFMSSFTPPYYSDCKKILDCGRKLEKKLDELNQAIRKHVHGVIQDAQQGIQPDTYVTDLE